MLPYENNREYLTDLAKLLKLKNDGSDAESLRNIIKNRAAISENVFLPVEYLIYLFNLNAFEEHILYTLSASAGKELEINHLYELYGCENNGVPLSIDSSLVEYSPSGGVKLNNRIANFIFNPNEPLNEPWINLYYPKQNLEASGYFFDKDVAAPVIKLAQTCLREQRLVSNIILLLGRPGVGRKSLVKYISGELALQILFVDLKQIVNAGLEAALRAVKLEALLMNAILCFDNIGCIENPAILLNIIKSVSKLTFFINKEHMNNFFFDDYIINEFEIPLPSFETRNKLWKSGMEKYGLSFDFHVVSKLYKFTPYQINSVLREVSTHGSGDLQDDILRVCRKFSVIGLGDFGKVIEPVFKWDDLVLPPDRKEMLKAAVNRIVYHDKVYLEWGFGEKLPYGMGMHILFAGPPGTGKTMAVQVLAGELELPVYKVDLSLILSKYIGETEKNLGSIFNKASDSGCILFFDEADALFAKRTDIKDSHDRYANTQVAYLLQKIEEYQGVTILATNLLKNFDEAFKRRFHFIIDFPFPEIEQRREIWEKAFPAAAPVANLDYGYLSECFKLTGGNIKNIALAAAFCAAAENRAIEMKDVISEIKKESAKTGLTVLTDNFEDYY